MNGLGQVNSSDGSRRGMTVRVLKSHCLSAPDTEQVFQNLHVKRHKNKRTK